MQDSKIFKKQQTNMHKYKNYILPSGKIIKIQGYEWKALDILLQFYSENEIITDVKKMPKFWYITKDGKKHKYYPDIYIPKENLIIEVKSAYTFNKDKEINILKQQSVLNEGYNFKFMIFD